MKNQHSSNLNTKDAVTHYWSVIKASLPTSIDRRKNGAVTEVKSQRQCGSCWAFSAVGAIEAAVFLKTGNLTSLSVQQLVDCVYPNEDSCKKGGMFVDAFGYVMRNELVTDSQYPYKARTGKCRLNSDSEGVKIRGYQRVKKFDEKALQYAVSRQPVCVTIWPDIKFENYTRGLFKIDFKDELNPSLHDVLVVGYGITRSRAPYWLIKNSYGTEWGEKGYMRMIRNYGNEVLRCITARPAYPIYKA